MDIETPTIDAILHWAQIVRNEKFIDENNKLILDSDDLKAPFKIGIPCEYGFTTIDDIVD